jgi:hypothetical protein
MLGAILGQAGAGEQTLLKRLAYTSRSADPLEGGYPRHQARFLNPNMCQSRCPGEILLRKILNKCSLAET